MFISRPNRVAQNPVCRITSKDRTRWTEKCAPLMRYRAFWIYSRQITYMRRAIRWFFVLAVGIWNTGYSAGVIEQMGYPNTNSVYKFEVYTGEIDRWDSTKEDAPRLSPGKACQVARDFVRTVPLRADMKEWGLSTVTLKRISSTPEEWLYLIHFDAQPKSDVWNGPVPWIEIPVRFDGTVPKPIITKSR